MSSLSRNLGKVGNSLTETTLATTSVLEKGLKGIYHQADKLEAISAHNADVTKAALQERREADVQSAIKLARISAAIEEAQALAEMQAECQALGIDMDALLSA